MNWFAVHTKPRQEAIAQQSLMREGVETYYPKLKRRRTIRRVRRWVIGPLFPGYIFARFDFERQHRLVRYATGVTNIVSFGGKAAVVDDQIIALIREHAEQDVITLPPPPLKPGELVEIKAGPFQGLQGIFERELSDAERVVILLDTLARGARMEIPRELIEKVS